MNRRILASSLILLALSAFGQRHSRFVPKEVWTDTDGKMINAHGGGVLFHKGTYYWYGESKTGPTIKPEHGMHRTDVEGVSCYSSRDLMNWKNEGLVLVAVPDDAASDLHPSQVVERPKVIYNKKTKKFVMWMHCDSANYGKAAAGVAISDSPTGPFRFLGSFRPNGCMSRDQTLFVDDDGTAYQICASEENQTLHINRLTDDYLGCDGVWSKAFEGWSREAPAMFKYKGRYYLLSSGCSGWDPNEADLAVADSVMGDWRSLGNPCEGPDADKTFYGQSTCVITTKRGLIACFDAWNKTNLADSRYIWLPLVPREGEGFIIPWMDSWSPVRPKASH